METTSYFCTIRSERVLQIDGEYIVIRFSTLIDRKERKKLSSKHENRIDDNASVPSLQVNLSKEVCCDDEKDVEENDSIDSIDNNNASAVILQVLSVRINKEETITNQGVQQDDLCDNKIRIEDNDGDNKKENIDKDNDDGGFNENKNTSLFDRVSKRISTLHPVNKLPKLLKRNDDNDNNNKKYSDHVLILLSALSKHNDDDNIDDSVRNNTSVDSIINTYLYSRRTSQRRNVHQRRRDL